MAETPPRAAASRHADGDVGLDPRLRRRNRHVGRGARGHGQVGRVDLDRVHHRPRNFGSRFSRNAASPSRKSSLRDDSSARTPRCAGAVRATGTSALCEQPLGEAERDRRSRRRARRRPRRPRPSSSSVGTARWIMPHSAASAPDTSRPSSSSSRARTSPTRRGSSHVAPLSGVNPRSTNGSQNRRVGAATQKSAASASLNPMPAAQPCTSQTTGIWMLTMQRDEPVRLRRQPALDAADPRALVTSIQVRCGPRCRRRRRSGRRRRRARSRAPPRRGPRQSIDVDEGRTSSRRRSRCASRVGRA